MKGLIIGVSFAVRDLFQFIKSIIIIPFSLLHPWGNGKILESPPVTKCCFVYLLFTCMVGLIGLILFQWQLKSISTDKGLSEGLFCQHDVKEILDL